LECASYVIRFSAFNLLFFRGFVDLNTLICCTLLGIVSMYRLSRDPLQLQLLYSKGTEGIEKVNALAVDGQWLAIGGFGKDGKGVVELWNRNNNTIE
jgi:hypothetical protein